MKKWPVTQNKARVQNSLRSWRYDRRTRNKVLAVEPLEAAKPRGEWGGDFVFLAASPLALGGKNTASYAG